MHRHRLKAHLRLFLQLLCTAVCNGYAAGFAGKGLFTGKSKALCVPVLNCYSCPGALGACPIGAMQTLAAGGRHRLSFYVLGTLMLAGTVFGRILCGFACPFGLVQDLLCKIPVPKLTVPRRLDRALRYLKYLVLLLLVILLPLFAVNEFGLGEPWFCKYLCPAGTLGGGVFQVLLNPPLRRLIGGLFWWKLGVMLFILLTSVFVSRCFCRYLCPLGAFYSLFSRFSLFQLRLDEEKCTRCHACSRACPMALDVPKQLQCGECIGCGKCREVCKACAITREFPGFSKQ